MDSKNHNFESEKLYHYQSVLLLLNIALVTIDYKDGYQELYQIQYAIIAMDILTPILMLFLNNFPSLRFLDWDYSPLKFWKSDEEAEAADENKEEAAEAEMKDGIRNPYYLILLGLKLAIVFCWGVYILATMPFEDYSMEELHALETKPPSKNFGYVIVLFFFVNECCTLPAVWMFGYFNDKFQDLE